jgi:hypothetical protein
MDRSRSSVPQHPTAVRTAGKLPLVSLPLHLRMDVFFVQPMGSTSAGPTGVNFDEGDSIMKVSLLTIALSVIAVLVTLHFVGAFRPAIVNAQAPLKVVAVENLTGPILGFSCVASSGKSACFVLTRQY